MPNGTDLNSVTWCQIVAEGEARTRLTQVYQSAIAQCSPTMRFWSHLRTVAEATWLPSAEPPQRVLGSWSLWSADGEATSEFWTWVRRGAKLAVVALTLLAIALTLFAGKRRRWNLVGGLMLVGSAVLLTSWYGAATNWVWLMPMILTGLVVHGGQSKRAPYSYTHVPPAGIGWRRESI